MVRFKTLFFLGFIFLFLQKIVQPPKAKHLELSLSSFKTIWAWALVAMKRNDSENLLCKLRSKEFLLVLGR